MLGSSTLAQTYLGGISIAPIAPAPPTAFVGFAVPLLVEFATDDAPTLSVAGLSRVSTVGVPARSTTIDVPLRLTAVV